MGIKSWYANTILDGFFAGGDLTIPATWYLGLSTTASDAAGANFTEPSGNGYARVALANDGTVFGASADGVVENTVSVAFPTTEDTWGTVVELGLFLAASGGVPAWTGAADEAPPDGSGVVFPSGRIPTLSAGQLAIAFETA